MRAHLEAIAAMLAPLGRDVYIGDVPGTPQFPYFILWAPPGRLEDETQDARQDTINDEVGVTGAAPTYADVLDLFKVARPLLIMKRPEVAGRNVDELRLLSSQPPEVDRDVTMPNGRFPAFAVDKYRLISEPLPA